MATDPWLIDDRAGPAPAPWRCFTDAVMGGVSAGELVAVQHLGRPALRLRGRVRTEFNGGFVQMALDLPPPPPGAAALVLDVAGPPDGARSYGLHLRTRTLTAPWQAWRSRFDVGPAWQTLQLPLAGFTPYRFEGTLVAADVRRIGLVALAFDGQPFDAELYFARAAWSA